MTTFSSGSNFQQEACGPVGPSPMLLPIQRIGSESEAPRELRLPRSWPWRWTKKGSADRGPPNLLARASSMRGVPICAAPYRSNPYRLFPTHTDICRSDSAYSTSISGRFEEAQQREMRGRYSSSWEGEMVTPEFIADRPHRVGKATKKVEGWRR